MPSDEGRFREVQHLRHTWVLAFVAAASALAWWPLVERITDGARSDGDPLWLLVGFTVLFGIGPIVVTWSMSLVVEVDAAAIHVHYRPLTRRTIALADVASAATVSYRPLRDCGGWGIRGWTRRKIAYNVSGRQGVLLTLADETSVLLGSRRPDELAAAIEAERGSLGRPG